MTGDAAIGIGIDLDSIDLQALSRRIVEAARLAVAAHLYESVRGASHAAGDDTDQTNGRRIGIGGAGPYVSNRRDGSAKDGDNPAPPPATADRSRRPSIFFTGAEGPRPGPDHREAGSK